MVKGPKWWCRASFLNINVKMVRNEPGIALFCLQNVMNTQLLFNLLDNLSKNLVRVFNKGLFSIIY